ncbi:NmrA family NAD(P)-binding protein [Burkholderia sp. 22PA0106]|uniref:NmrA family NAD(P)-binding protein n=1 Tax=Burkholderia sp. 22PA0106 TaxID=3237371 RepID=UPI0039C2C740
MGSSVACERMLAERIQTQTCNGVIEAMTPWCSIAVWIPRTMPHRRSMSAIHREVRMFAVTCVSGRVGGVTARRLLARGHDVRAVIRDPARAAAWSQQGCAVAIADLRSPSALVHAFEGAEGVFVMLPPNFDPLPGFEDARQIILAIREAINVTRPSKVVGLSSIGAHQDRPSLLSQLNEFERVMGEVDAPVAFVRAAWFMENAAWDIGGARETGEIPSFLQPVERALPMVSTTDVGQVVAETLEEEWMGTRIIELAGRDRISPNDIAATFSRLIGRDVRARAVPRETWESLFRAQGMNNPLPRVQMLDGLNEGWLTFQGRRTETRIGRVTLKIVLRELIRDEV